MSMWPSRGQFTVSMEQSSGSSDRFKRHGSENNEAAKNRTREVGSKRTNAFSADPIKRRASVLLTLVESVTGDVNNRANPVAPIYLA